MPRTIPLLLLITCSVDLTVCDRCCDINQRALPHYNLIKHNYRSTQLIISRKVVTNASECEKFVASKKALAFNFVSARNRAGVQEYTCQALQCPEDHNMTTLVRARDYDYYSMYPIYVPAANTTVGCVPKAGIFLFAIQNLNYTLARSFCQEQNASLAHVISEERTDGLAKFIPQNTPSFVGLSSSDKERIWKNEYGESLTCFDYRAWGEGEPSHSKGCAALVNQTDKGSPPFWRVMPCYTPLPFICEIWPSTEQVPQPRPRHRQRG